MKYICFLVPGLLALKHAVKEKDKPYQIIAKYGGYTLLINMCIMFALLLLEDPHTIVGDGIFTIRMSFLYLLVGSFLAIILPGIINYLQENIKVSLKRNKRWEV